MQLSVIILNWNGKEDTLECLKSLESSCAKLIVVDNASTDGSAEAVQKAFPQVDFVQSGANLGYAGGNNVGIAHAFKQGADAVLILNNDVQVSHNMVDAFIEMHQKHPNAILGGNPYCMREQHVHDIAGGQWNAQECNFDLVYEASDGAALDFVTGCCLFLPGTIYETIGAFESNFFLYWEDSDLCARAKSAGFEVLHCAGAKLWHKGSASMTPGGAHHSYFWWRGRLLYIKRNCSTASLKAHYLKVLLPAVARLAKHYVLKLCQSYVYKLRRKDLGIQRRRALRKYRASFQGINDYFSGKFGNAPHYIFTSVEN